MSDDFAEFYTAHFREIAAQLYAYVGDYCEAQDIAQEAFCRALDRWGRVRAYDHPLSWVRHVAWNLASSRLRHLQVAMRHLARQRPQHVDGPEPDRVALVQALACLPPNHRMAVVLHHIAELSTSEIARQRGVAEGTVRSWLSRGRSQLAEQFAEYRPEFTPPGVAATAATVKSRRALRRSTLAALLLVVVAALAATLLRGTGKPDVISPTPVETRTAGLPGVDITEPPEIVFVDALHGWLFYRSCQATSRTDPEVPPLRRHRLGVTSDAGRSWRPVDLPASAVLGAAALLHAVDADTVVLSMTSPSRPTELEGYFVSRDGGASFTWYPMTGDVAAPRELAGGRYQVQCAGTRRPGGCYDSPMEVVDVRTEVKVDSPLERTILSAGVTVGKDGRIWLRTFGPGMTARLFVHFGGSWREVAWPSGGRTLQLSADGERAWVTGQGNFWELDGADWVLRMSVELPLDKVDPVLIGDELWLVFRDAKYWYLRNSVLTEVEEVENLGVGKALPDGSVTISGPGGTFLGTGPDMNKRWVYLKL